jgi:hypothetical protein
VTALFATLLVFALTFGIIAFRFFQRRSPSLVTVSVPIVLTVAWLLLSGPWQAFQAESKRVAREWALTAEYGDLPDQTIAASSIRSQRCVGVTVDFENGDDRPFDGRSGLPVDGHDAFIVDVQRALNDIATYAPARYDEVIEYLPQAVYERGWIRKYYGPNVLALSNGYFAIDAADFGHGQFLETLLHEAGHNVLAYRVDDYVDERYSEEEIDVLVEQDADRYAGIVMREMNTCRANVP